MRKENMNEMEIGIKNCPNYWMEESGSSFSIAREACLHEYKGIGNLN